MSPLFPYYFLKTNPHYVPIIILLCTCLLNGGNGVAVTEAGLNVLRRPPAAGGEGDRAVMCGG